MEPTTNVLYMCAVCGWETPENTDTCKNCDNTGTLEISGLRPMSEVTASDTTRVMTGISAVDRVLGGGLVPGSVVLLGGLPGLGKSTLLTQVALTVARMDKTVAYISAEESLSQMRLRVDRLVGAGDIPVSLLVDDSTDLKLILNRFDRVKPALAIVDSVQAIQHPSLRSATGSQSQVRGCAERLLAWGKRHKVPVILVGHVNKGGKVAGPQSLVHMVDALLYLEPSKRFIAQRRLYANKNRFGSTTEEATFAMAVSGLREWIVTENNPQGEYAGGD